MTDQKRITWAQVRSLVTNGCDFAALQDQAYDRFVYLCLDFAVHHARYDALDPQSALKDSAAGKVIFIAGASRGIGQSTAPAFAEAGAMAVYLTARSEEALEETQNLFGKSQPEYAMCLLGL